MRLIAVLAVLSLVACERSPTAPANRLLVTAFAMPDTVRAGDVIAVTIGITNVSDQPQTYESNFCGPAYRVYNAAGAILDGSLACLGISQPRTLAPGAQDLYSSAWTTTTGSPSAPLPTGSYKIRGAVDGDGVENLAYVVQVMP